MSMSKRYAIARLSLVQTRFAGQPLVTSQHQRRFRFNTAKSSSLPGPGSGWNWNVQGKQGYHGRVDLTPQAQEIIQARSCRRLFMPCSPIRFESLGFLFLSSHPHLQLFFLNCLFLPFPYILPVLPVFFIYIHSLYYTLIVGQYDTSARRLHSSRTNTFVKELDLHFQILQ